MSSGWIGAGALAVILAAGGLAAQESTDNRVAAETDWSVFQETDPTECFSVSAPTEQVNTRDGAPVAVTRGETLLFIRFSPTESEYGVLSFTGGYPFAAASSITMEVGTNVFQLTPGDLEEGEDPNWAWNLSVDLDQQIISALKNGSQAILMGESARGTLTRDTFSLIGFTASLEAAAAACGQ